MKLNEHELKLLRDTGKAQIRRALDPQPKNRMKYSHYDAGRNKHVFVDKKARTLRESIIAREGPVTIRSPFKPGDVMWHKEAWAAIWKDNDPCECQAVELCGACQEHDTIEYRADTTDKYPGGWPDNLDDEDNIDPDCPLWQPANTMPEWASRLKYKVLDVRCERLMEIDGGSYLRPAYEFSKEELVKARSFIDQWDADNPQNLSEDDPWVFVGDLEVQP